MAGHTLILIGVFVYFGIGASIAFSLTALSMGFAGRFEPQVIAIFFFWPIFYLVQIPFVALVLAGFAAAGLMTYLASLALQHF